MGKILLLVIAGAGIFFYMQNNSKSGTKKASAIIRVYDGKKIIEEKRFSLTGNDNYLADKGENIIFTPNKVSVNTMMNTGPGKSVGPFSITNKNGVNTKSKLLLFEEGKIKIYFRILFKKAL